MFNNECLERLSYEATTSAIVMAGIFISFLIEYASHRFIGSRTTIKPEIAQTPTTANHETPTKSPTAQTTAFGHHGQDLRGTGHTKLSIMILEAAILFHSLILGLTLVVAGDGFYTTLFIVIVFHQFFEGLALGSRIASIPASMAPMWPTKLAMGLAFTSITPLGMAIGIGVLQRFNGNDPGTIVAIGTLDAISAGILIWVGVVEMWAADWIVPGGELSNADVSSTSVGGFGLVAGLLLMSVLGKWA